MPATTTKEFLSNSTTGQPTAVAADSTPGTPVHTAHATAKDEIWLKASNVTAVDEVLTLEFGGTGLGNELYFTVPANETIVVVGGDLLGNSLVLAAYSVNANAINVVGFVNRHNA